MVAVLLSVLLLIGYVLLEKKRDHRFMALFACVAAANCGYFLQSVSDTLIGAMMFSYDSGSIEFLGIHPQYRRKGIQKLFLDVLLEDYLPGREICMTTFREGDKAEPSLRPRGEAVPRRCHA